MYKITSYAVCTVALLIGATVVSAAQPKIKLQPKQTVYLYPEGQKAGKGLPEAQGPIEDNGLTGDEILEPNGNMSNTGDQARMDFYFPKKANGQMVIVCPGGGYRVTSTYNEGLYVAEWMIERGITVCVVKYRMPNNHWKVPLQDVQNAFRYCRAHAEEWKVNQIGVMGFSAGGHLAASASTLFVDEITRPDFSILIYPVISLGPGTHSGTKLNLLGKEEKWLDENLPMSQWIKNKKTFEALCEHYTLSRQVSPATPATFIGLSADDKTVGPINSIEYFGALQLNNVPVEMHIWPTGGHGWGFTKQAYKDKGKTDRFAAWRNDFYYCLDNWLKNIRK